MLPVTVVKSKCDIFKKLALNGGGLKLCLSFTRDSFSIRIGEKGLEKSGGDNLMIYVNTNTIIGARIIVTFRERIFYKRFINEKDLAFGTFFPPQCLHETELIKCYGLLKFQKKGQKTVELCRRIKGK